MSGEALKAQIGDARLLAWSRLARKRVDEGLGYPKISPTFKEAIKGKGGVTLMPDDFFICDRAVAWMRNNEPDLFWAVYWWYIKSCPQSVCAVRLRCSVRTLQRRLIRARLIVGGGSNVT